MRRTLLFVLLLVCAAFAHARSYTASENPLRPGWWYDPAQRGWAFTLSPAGDELAGTLLTFDRNGEATWYLTVGRGDGRTWTLPVTRHLWDVAANRPLRTETIGTFTFTLEAEGRARASWTIDGQSGSANLALLELAPGYSAEDRSGHWSVDGETGHGYTVYSQGDWLSVVHYGYDASGQPRWVYADNHGIPAHRPLDAVYFRRACATCDATVHDAGRISMDLPFENGGTASLALSLPAPLSGGFIRRGQPISLISDLPSGRTHPAALARFASDTTLGDYVRAAIAQRGYGANFCGIDYSPGPPAPTAIASTTNVQESGVDEADTIESDGEYTYAIAMGGDAPRASHLLRTHRLMPERADLVSTSELAFTFTDNDSPSPDGLYLVPASEDRPRTLAAVRGERYGYGIGFGFGFPGGCGGFYNGKTWLELYSLGDRGRPAFTRRVSLDGSLVASRRIGRTVYLVTRHIPELRELTYAQDAAGIARNAALLAAAPLERLLPTIRVDNAAARALVSPTTTFLPPLPPGDRVPVLLTVTAVALDDPTAHRSVTVVGSDDGVYVSAQSLYLATSRVRTRMVDGRYEYPFEYFTDFHRIALDRLVYAASGTAPGTLGYHPDKKAFHMSEHAGNFRVLTEQYQQGGTLNRVFVFAENAATRRLDEVGHLPNPQRPEAIGKPNELLYAIRFVGERAYAVTFLKVDPLYAIDLSNPRDPKLTGALDLPGFSAYLHPFGENRLLGFGLDAASSTITGDDGTFAWFQGLKLSLFDVSDASAPRQVANRDIGKRGSGSALLGDHHAFATLATGGVTRLAVPVDVHDVLPPATPSPDPRTYYPFTWSGLALYELDAAGRLVDRGQLVAVRYDDPSPGGWYQRSAYDARPLLVGDAVYLFQGGGWYGARWATPQQRSPRR